jgi:hypothetical protein
MLLVFLANLFLPSVAYALTSGPAQPEAQGFQPAGISDMVDLETGDFKYNIPLLDIDGYPINLNYHSGSGIDDEASWVGLGWSLNTGAINRQVRGLPDDYNGGAADGDKITVDHYTKPKITIGGKANVKAELFGIAAFNTKVSGTFTLGLFSDNYTGVGAEVGANAGISYAMPNEGMLTAGLGLGVLSNTQSGVDANISPYVNLSLYQHGENETMEKAGLSANL